jgi:putative intracellular protease/amidase
MPRTNRIPIIVTNVDESEKVGHGVCFDFEGPDQAKLTASFRKAWKIVSAVCRGPAGPLEVKLPSVEDLIGGKKVTGFSWDDAARRLGVPSFVVNGRIAPSGAQPPGLFRRASEQAGAAVVAGDAWKVDPASGERVC